MFKQVIVVRSDLKISRGKWAAQTAHASLSCCLKVLDKYKNWFDAWQKIGQKKVVLKVDSLEELLKIKDKAKELRVPYDVVKDAGLTEIPPGTITCIAIGPAPSGVIDKITGDLSLFK